MHGKREISRYSLHTGREGLLLSLFEEEEKQKDRLQCVILFIYSVGLGQYREGKHTMNPKVETQI